MCVARKDIKAMTKGPEKIARQWWMKKVKSHEQNLVLSHLIQKAQSSEKDAKNV